MIILHFQNHFWREIEWVFTKNIEWIFRDSLLLILEDVSSETFDKHDC